MRKLKNHIIKQSLGVQKKYLNKSENKFLIISFYEQLQKFFSPILLINYIISSLLICMVGLQIVAVNINSIPVVTTDYYLNLTAKKKTI